MPAVAQPPTIALLVKLSVEQATCMVCSRESQPIVYVLYEIAANGSEQENGLAYCAACAAKHGHRKALVAAIADLEATMLSVDAEEGTPEDEAETKTEMAHLRSLIAGGKLTAPPVIPVKCFARMVS